MLSSAKLLTLAQNAADDALEYRIEAVTAADHRKPMLSKWADQRDADAKFYRNKAWYEQQFEARHHKQEAA